MKREHALQVTPLWLVSVLLLMAAPRVQAEQEADQQADEGLVGALSVGVAAGGAAMRFATYYTGTDEPTPRHLTDLGRAGVYSLGLRMSALAQLASVGLGSIGLGAFLETTLTERIWPHGRDDQAPVYWDLYREQRERGVLYQLGLVVDLSPRAADTGLYGVLRFAPLLADFDEREPVLGLGSALELGYQWALSSQVGLRTGFELQGAWAYDSERGDFSDIEYQRRWYAVRASVSFVYILGR